SGWLMTLLVLGIMFAVIGYAMYAGVWQSPVPEELYRRLIPQAPMIGH
ncbi:4Fe-4S binding protein, partial [Escherichia coli]